MPAILFDDQIFAWDGNGGIRRYFAELIAALGSRDGVDLVLPAPIVRSETLARSVAVYRPCAPRILRPIKRSGRLTRLVNGHATRQRLRRGGIDVIHVTYNDCGILSDLGATPFVLTVHDLIPEKFGARYPRLQREIKGRAELIRRAARLIAVSDHTKADLISCYGAAAERIDVIYHGVSAATVHAPGRARPQFTPERFILFVGQRETYKNFMGAAPALARLLRRIPDLHLLCVGAGPLLEEERLPFAANGCDERVSRATLSDGALAWAYAHADALIVPSLDEGFGMTVLEAFANGCPVAISDRGALPEIASGAALTFDPENEADIEAALEQLVLDRHLGLELRAAGRERAAAFSWERAASQHLECYAKAIAEPPFSAR